MKKGASALFILAFGACMLSADVYVSGGVGLGVAGGGVSSTTTRTTTTTTSAAEKAPQFSLGSYDGGEYPLSVSEAAWALAKANIVTGARLGDRNGLSEQAFAMASLIYKSDTVDARATFKEVFNVSNEIEGKLYGLMGMKILGDEEGYRERSKLLDSKATVNCLVNGKYYVVTVESFLRAFEKNMYTFVPNSFPEAPVVAAKPAQTGVAVTDSTTTTTTTTAVVTDYYPSYYWGPSYVVINIRPRPPRPHPPRPRPHPRPIPGPTPGARPTPGPGVRPTPPPSRPTHSTPRPTHVPAGGRPQQPNNPPSRPRPDQGSQTRPPRPQGQPSQQRPPQQQRPQQPQTRPAPQPQQQARPAHSTPRPTHSTPRPTHTPAGGRR